MAASRGRLSVAVGLVGLPNVGKSSLFNYLCKEQLSYVANYPFATIEPTQAMVMVPDRRLEGFAQKSNSKRIIHDYVQVHDIAGLVKGASTGAGLGNAFLSHIRAVDAIVHVCREFEDPDVIHVHEGKRNPIKDIEVVELELILADLDSVERRLVTVGKKPGMEKEKEALNEVRKVLLEGQRPSLERFGVDLKHMNLLSLKPVLYALITDDVGGNERTRALQAQLGGPDKCLPISSKLENDLANETDEEMKLEMAKEFGLEDPEQSSIYRLSQAISKLLQRRVFYTVGPQEARSWAMAPNETAVEAASRIHNDIAKGFINCDISRDVDDGPVKTEGKEYKMQDGDIVFFRHRG
ncbi:GTP-binding protein YchF [Batrachochytrium salamandrivorans]|nr:GTP-binding protein YchF [Batrachochytrium salamandrivorans]